jgi:hypothetical protein
MKKIILWLVSGLLALGVGALAVFIFVVQNVETPVYQVVTQDGAFELRDYPALVVAEVTREGARKTALRAGFSPLAGYIFAKERSGESVPMTAPVTQQREEPIAMTVPVTQTPTEAGKWTVRFIMPAAYTRENLPAPASADVKLLDVPARRAAAVRFSGRATDDLIAAQELALREWLKSRNLTPVAAPIYAYYNDPLTPGIFRRNEVIIDSAPIAPESH